MSEYKPAKSISQIINRRQVVRLLISFIIADIILLSAATCIWCFNTELTEKDHPKLTSVRYLTSISSVPAKYEDDLLNEKSQDKSFSLLFPAKVNNFANNMVYAFEDKKGNIIYKYAGDFFSGLFSVMYILWAVQLLQLLSKGMSGAYKIKKELAPLDEVAFKAKVLGNTTAFDPAAYQELEKAINSISPSKEGASLNTGNAELKHLEDSINHLLERMRESYHQQARFVSDASHELRTPLSILQGYINMLDRWGKTDEVILNESIDAIKSETAHMEKLVEQLLFLARGDSGKTQLKIEDFSLNTMIQEVFEESQMIDREHQYIYQPFHEDIMISGDISMLKQTARILIDNAVKYTEKNAAITLRTCLNDNGDPTFIIQDEGIGMSDSELSQIFKRFYRSDPARAKNSGGQGLGLSIAKWIVDRHGGYFNVISHEGIGTRISVTIPFHT